MNRRLRNGRERWSEDINIIVSFLPSMLSVMRCLVPAIEDAPHVVMRDNSRTVATKGASPTTSSTRAVGQGVHDSGDLFPSFILSSSL